MSQTTSHNKPKIRDYSLEAWYKKYKGYVNVVGSYLEEPTMPFLIRSCRLRPLSVTSKILPKSPILEKLWMDEYRNILRIGKNKRTKILFGDLAVAAKDAVQTDIFAHVSIPDLYRISKLMYCCHGIDDITGQDIVILSFLGKDNYFRTRIYQNGEWDKNVSTLILGQYLLRTIIENLSIRYFIELPERYIPHYPMIKLRHWLTYLPSHYQFGSVLKSESELITQIIGLDSQELI